MQHELHPDEREDDGQPGGQVDQPVQLLPIASNTMNSGVTARRPACRVTNRPPS